MKASLFLGHAASGCELKTCLRTLKPHGEKDTVEPVLAPKGGQQPKHDEK